MSLNALVAANDVSDKHFRRILELSTRAIIAWYESDFAGAAKSLQTMARSVVQRISNELPVQKAIRIHALCWAAACLIRLGKLKLATSLLEQAGRSVKDVDMPNCRGWYHAECGRLAYWRNDLELAHREYSQAAAFFQESKNRFGLVEVSDAQARLYTHRGLYDLALQQLALSEQWREYWDTLGQAQGLYHRARIFRFREDYQKAMGLLKRALAEINAIGNKRWEANIRDVMGDVCLMLGDLDGAADQYGARVIVRSEDPIVQLRRHYCSAKLRFAKAMREKSRTQRSRQLRQILGQCAELLQEPGRKDQMLEQKILFLEGRVLHVMGEFSAAVSKLRRAARGFASSGAPWYQTETLVLAGRCLIAAGEELQGAQVLLAGLKDSVDDVQKSQILGLLESHFEQIGVDGVCQRLSELYGREQQLMEACVVQEKLSATLRGVVQNLSFVAERGVNHVLRDIPKLRGNGISTSEREAWCRCIEQDALMSRFVLHVQRQLLNHSPSTTGRFHWLSLAETLKDAGGSILPVSTLRAIPRHLGLYADESSMRQALGSIMDIMETWTRRTKWRFELDSDWATITAVGNRRPSKTDQSLSDILDVHVFFVPRIVEYGISPEQFAEIQSAKVIIEAVGGQLQLSKQEPTTLRVQPFRLDVRLPVEEMPLTL